MDDFKKVSAQVDLRRKEPIKITGNFEIIGIDGNKLTTDYTEEAYLCACGRSKSKPFCDGSHKT